MTKEQRCVYCDKTRAEHQSDGYCTNTKWAARVGDAPVTSKHESPLQQYFRIRPVIVEDEPEAQRIEFHVGNQSFAFGPEYCESMEHAEWFVAMGIKAIHNAFKGMCNKCDGHGYVDEGDPESGPCPATCDDCGGKGKITSVETQPAALPASAINEIGADNKSQQATSKRACSHLELRRDANTWYCVEPDCEFEMSQVETQPAASKQQLIDMLTERSRKHDAFRLAETACTEGRADGYSEQMNAYDIAHGEVLDWMGDADNLNELLGFLRAHETKAPQCEHEWSAIFRLHRCLKGCGATMSTSTGVITSLEPRETKAFRGEEDTAGLPLTVKDWVAERLENSLQIAMTKSGEDRAGWIQDARYWRLIYDRLAVEPFGKQPGDDNAQTFGSSGDGP